MGFLSNKKKSTTNVTQITDTTATTLEDIEDSVAITGNRDSVINVTTTDQGALDLAEAVSGDAAEALESGFAELTDLSRDVIDAGAAANERTTIALVEGQEEAFAFAEGSQGEAFSFAGDALEESFDVVGDFATQFGDFAANQSSELRDAITEIQARESGNTDARLGDITRTALIVAGVVVVAGVAIVVFGDS